MSFGIKHLDSYDDESLLAEIKRVAALIQTPKITLRQFNSLAKVHGSTVQRRFGGWKGALKAAEIGDRFYGSCSKKSREEILDAIKAVAGYLQKDIFTFHEFRENTGISHTPIKRIFRTWNAALVDAGIRQATLKKSYTDEECFENMLIVWTHYGRPPQRDEMNQAPSAVGSKAYLGRWGTWGKAIIAFVDRIYEEPSPSMSEFVDQPAYSEKKISKSVRGLRDIPLSLRYNVLERDNFRCVICGTSPATSPGVVLHVDYIIPWASGGPTVIDNLRTLCPECNLGKSASPA